MNDLEEEFVFGKIYLECDVFVGYPDALVESVEICERVFL